MWRIVSLLEDGRKLLDGDGLTMISADYVEPWPTEVLDELRELAAGPIMRSCSIVGAHIGEPVIALAGMCGDIRAYEPNPANCYLLMENLELNGVRATVRCEAVSSADGRYAMRIGGSDVRVERVGVNRVLNGRIDLAVLACPECDDVASSLGCEALSLVGRYIFRTGSRLGGRLESCGFQIREASTESLAVGPRATFKRR
jgi:hypothetical protein